MNDPLIFKCPDCNRIWIHYASCNYFYIKDSLWPKVETEWPHGGEVTTNSCLATMEDPPECPAVIQFYKDRAEREKNG